ncbi:phasin family protein [Rhodoblastus sp.]|uniref:phasin family protein n=1 Tax=Rhodoblastus sp. TaxID=1962975 RepID=UPI003F9D3FB7
MTTAQQNIGQSSASGFANIFDGVTNFNGKAHEVADELAEITKENIGAGVNAAQRLLGAKTLQDVVTIEMDLMKAAYETMTTHSRKISEINASTREEFAKNYGNVFSSLSKSGSEFTQKATEMTRSMGEKASNSVQQMGGQAMNAARQNAKTTGNGARA